MKEVEKEKQGNDSIQINLGLNAKFWGRGGVSCPHTSELSEVLLYCK